MHEDQIYTGKHGGGERVLECNKIGQTNRKENLTCVYVATSFKQCNSGPLILLGVYITCEKRIPLKAIGDVRNIVFLIISHEQTRKKRKQEKETSRLFSEFDMICMNN